MCAFGLMQSPQCVKIYNFRYNANPEYMGQYHMKLIWSMREVRFLANGSSGSAKLSPVPVA